MSDVEDAKILRAAAIILAGLEARFKKDESIHAYNLALHRIDLIATAEILEGVGCECGHKRQKHYHGGLVSPQCRICECDEFKAVT